MRMAEPTARKKAGFESWAGNTKAFFDAQREARTTPAGATAAEIPYNLELCESFRHSGWMPARKRVDAALASLPEISPRRIGAFRSCGADAYVEQAVYTSKYRGGIGPIDQCQWRVRSTKCHDRFCVPCSNERSMRVRDSLLIHMQPLEGLKLIGLTLKHSTAPLSDTLDRITKAFRAVRQLPLWKKAVKGGCAIIETKIADDAVSWHTHFHIIAESKYLPQDKLSAAWKKITGDSFIVDVRPVGAKSGAIKYITKYITKAADSSIVNSPKHLKEAIIAFTGRRLVSTFGTWRGLQLMERPNEEKTVDEVTTWKVIGRIDEIMHWAKLGDPVALRILRHVAPARALNSS